MIQTWMADITPLYEVDNYKKYYDKVPEFRKEKADKIRAMQGKFQSVGAWFLLMQMRKEYGVPEEAVFNLSHSGQYVLCSIEDSREKSHIQKIGCDIEMLGEMKEKIAKRFFCEKEASYITGRSTKEEKTQAFYRYWVLKESFMKATRLGMKLDMRSFEIGFDKADHAVLLCQPEEIKEKYYYHEYKAENVTAKIAVCSTSDCFGVLRMLRLFN